MSWLPGWNNRIIITISSSRIDTTLSNFPLLLNISEQSGIHNDDMSDFFNELDDGSGVSKKFILVTSADAPCYCEIEYFSIVEKKLVMWAKIPSISSSTNTVLYLYYDKDHQDNNLYLGYTGDLISRNVWSTEYKGVYHLSNVSSMVFDSTSNANNAFPMNIDLETSLVEGKCGQSINFDGTDDYIRIPHHSSIKPSQLTASSLVHNSDWSIAPNGMFISSRESTGYALGIEGSSLIAMWNISGAGVRTISYSKSSISPGWHLFTSTHNGSIGSLYVDHQLVASSSLSGSIVQHASNSVFIGAEAAAGTLPETGYFYNGLIDETRILNVSKSAAWVKADYYNMFDILNTYELELHPRFYFSGFTMINHTLVGGRKVLAYRRDTGEYMNETVSEVDGSFYLETTYSGTHFIIALDDDAGENYNDVVVGNILPSSMI
jgi:trimeric autotransporter adhesin